MEKKEIIDHLNSVLDRHNDLSKEQKLAINEVIIIVKKAKNKEQFIKAVDIIIKLLGIGSNFFN